MEEVATEDLHTFFSKNENEMQRETTFVSFVELRSYTFYLQQNLLFLRSKKILFLFNSMKGYKNTLYEFRDRYKSTWNRFKQQKQPEVTRHE